MHVDADYQKNTLRFSEPITEAHVIGEPEMVIEGSNGESTAKVTVTVLVDTATLIDRSGRVIEYEGSGQVIKYEEKKND